MSDDPYCFIFGQDGSIFPIEFTDNRKVKMSSTKVFVDYSPVAKICPACLQPSDSTYNLGQLQADNTALRAALDDLCDCVRLASHGMIKKYFGPLTGLAYDKAREILRGTK